MDETGTWIENRAGADVLRVRTVRLDVIDGPDRGLTKTFSAPAITLGRANADFPLADRRVSALHAELRLEAGGFRLRDLGSTNGTHVGNVRVIEALVPAGTTILLGDSQIRFTPLDSSFELPLASTDRLEGFVGGGVAMRRMYELIARYATTDATVLVTGETGSGKEVAAEAIHLRSKRKGKPFLVLDCGAIPAQLVEDQLFGHEAGAFTGAGSARPGVFEAAHGGTLFLDEIGELPIEVQPKLLRAVETKTIYRLGSTDARKCDVRIVAATNRDLAGEVNRDRFRADLYFRLAVARVHVPPLREHREDLDALIDHFAAKLGGAVTPEFRAWARKHPWPGNVRELRGAIEQALALAKRPELLANLYASAAPSHGLDIDVSLPFKETKRKLLDELERRYITELLDAHGGNVSAAARAADLDRMTIYKMLRRAGLRDPE